MKRLFILFIVFNTLILNCSNDTFSPISEALPERVFKIYKGNWQFDNVKCRLVGEGKYGLFYADVKNTILNNVNEAKWQGRVEEFDKYYNKMVEIYGKPSDIDGNGKVILLFYENPYSNGYFQFVDLTYDNGNMAEILYIDDKVMNWSSWYIIEEVIFHELQHLINFNMGLNILGKYEALWLNEALSTSTHYLLNTQRGNYNNYPTPSNFFAWNSSDNNYKTVELLMYWLYRQGGEKLISDISKSLYRDVGSIISAVNMNIPELRNADWADIYGTWLVANYMLEKEGLYGYNLDTINFTIDTATTEGKSSVMLAPGEAVYVFDEGFIETSHHHISYKKIPNSNIKVVYNSSSEISELKVSANIGN